MWAVSYSPVYAAFSLRIHNLFDIFVRLAFSLSTFAVIGMWGIGVQSYRKVLCP